MKHKLMLVLFSALTFNFTLNPFDGTKPVFSTTDALNSFGEWQTSAQLTTKGKEDIPVTLGYRHKVVKKFALTCRYTVELKNESDKKIQFYYVAGNNRTNYFGGSAGTIKEKVKLDPGETVEINYPLPTKNFKPADDADECKKCKELDHLFMIGDLEAK